ncbi:MAG: tRNA (adenosine(37)-N6)-dimethylallyltransferase MiaA [Campylobacterota bacterium]|nr:tRNA (adenosine(37)-N6)-dimethylallyltransferase MiaA [Campylobacterota bacterium]
MYKELAIIAPTASGKTELSISLAHKLNAIILSLDSLSVYKKIDIASAKPTIKERDGIKHFGIDKIAPNQNFDVVDFIQEYKIAKQYAKENNKNLIIVGGTGFYLKSMIDGLSKSPKISENTKQIVEEKLEFLHSTYNMLYKIDEQYMKKISSNDKYRIKKALEIYEQTTLTPTQYFNENKPEPIVEKLKIFQIDTDVTILRDRIFQRTKKMIKNGIINEVIELEHLYTRKPNCMKSIGIKECLDFLDGRLDKKNLEYQISTHTAQLAKRQRTFNKSQFCDIVSDNLKNLEKKILSMV